MSLRLSQDITRIEIGGRSLGLTPISESPCRRACPAGIDVKKYVGQIAAGDFDGALETIRRHMPFPSVCGRICLHPCETECLRGKVDKPVAIMHLKRFVSDLELREGREAPLPEAAPPTGRRVAVIGSGPAGLTAAHDLVLMGHSVTVFEKATKPGGMLTLAIPEFQLPLRAVMHDIDRIVRLGVEIRLNSGIDGGEGIERLLSDGFDAVIIAAGAAGRWPGLSGNGWIEGAYLDGCAGAAEFMRSHRAGSPESVWEGGRTVAVLGFGVQALACARTAVRLGAEVLWLVPFDRSDLQPDSRLVRQAEEEGVKIVERTMPLAVVGNSGKVTGIRCVEVELSGPDHTGRRVWSGKPGSESIIQCTDVIDAAYSMPETLWAGFSSGPWNVIPANPDTMATDKPGVFAAGDIVSGPKSVVEAVAMGHRAAAGIDRFFRNDSGPIGTLSKGSRIPGWAVDDPEILPSKFFRPGVRPAAVRALDFHEVELAFSAWEAVHEARRCLLCGPCEECAVCVPSCTRRKAVAKDASGNTIVVRLPFETAKHLSRQPDSEVAGSLLTARVDPARCRACGVCELVCGYHAPRVGVLPNGLFASSIDILACKGCGTCVAACPSGAIDQGMTSLFAVRKAIGGKPE